MKIKEKQFLLVAGQKTNMEQETMDFKIVNNYRLKHFFLS